MKLLASVALAALIAAAPASAEVERYSVIAGGQKVGHLDADVQGPAVTME
jgi:hypothetical protein